MSIQPRNGDRRGAQTAVLLINYGGPGGPDECKPYLNNIFMDPGLIPMPSLVRPLVAAFAARRRAPSLRRIYEAMGRYSPTLEETRAQAKALEGELGEDYACYPAMRYWKPFIGEVCRKVLETGHDRIVLLPLYPQESTTTTGSAEWEARDRLKELGFGGSLAVIHSFWNSPGYLDPLAGFIKSAVGKAAGETRVLFTAHGLPVKVAKSDKYPRQVAKTVLALSEKAGLACAPIAIPGPARTGEELFRNTGENDGLVPAALAWQSRIGPVRWLEPSVNTILNRFAKEGAGRIVAAPVAFVNEHSETLYELDILYAGLANDLGMAFERVPTLGIHPDFIRTLAELCREALR